MENTGGFQAAFDALTKLQEVQFSALRSDMVEVKADVKALSARQDQTEELLDGVQRVVELLSALGDKKNLALAGGVFSAVMFVAQWLARLFS